MAGLTIILCDKTVSYNPSIKHNAKNAGRVASGDMIIIKNNNTDGADEVICFGPFEGQEMKIAAHGSVHLKAVNVGAFRFNFWKDGGIDPDGEIIVHD